MITRLDERFSVHFDGKAVFFFGILLFLPDLQSIFVAAIKMIEYLHDMAVAAILHIQHDAEVIRNPFIERFEIAFFVQLCKFIVDLFGYDLLVQPFKILFSHMTQVVHRRKLTVIPDQHDRFTIQNRDQKIEKSGLGNLIHDNDINILRTNIHSLDPVIAQFFELVRRKPIAAGACDTEHVDVVVQNARKIAPILFQNILLREIFADITIHRDFQLVFIFSLCITRFELVPFFFDDRESLGKIIQIIFRHNTEIVEKAVDLLFQRRA